MSDPVLIVHLIITFLMQTWKPNMFTRVIATLFVLPMMFSSPAKANTIDDHNRLLRAAGAAGVNVKINPSDCDEGQYYGWYSAADRELVICQENKIQGSSQQVSWTDEDLDTVRHETHHLVQDCRDYSLNGRLHAVYDDPVGLAAEWLTKRKGLWVIDSYGEKGSHIVTMELEAFAVAAMNDPAEQVRDVRRFCL